MSYYPPPGTGTTYPYGSYPAPGTYPPHPQTAGAYPTAPYQTAYPPTAVSGYGGTWPYHYSYYPPQQPVHTPLAAPKPSVTPTSVVATPAVATTATATPAVAIPAPTRPAPTTSTYTFTPTYARESVAAAGSGGATRVRNLMYGFGDDRNPANDTVNVMEEILIEYIVDVVRESSPCQTALAPGKKSRLSIEDLRRALSRPADAKKLARMEELLFMQEDIKRARAQFEESDMNQATSFQS
ncbi:Transcription initiation factor TFIID subunit 13 [Grifola frondosa]|uniref:Transcription initiation factor TFIID subunit 13 n=1 Tax=Grifola frondosa TaxID=5627 RepID=A0A1C7ME05_GRIFR|nr:Transcription initiation factor TFIID subunit 13 [Grifola frondosa]